MSKRTLFVMMSLFLHIFAIYSSEDSFAEGLKIGTKAPFFKVVSGDDKELTLDMIKGKVAVIFYETKDVVEKNRKLKNELNKFYFEQTESTRELIMRMPVIDCSGALWPFTGIWRHKLRDNSKKEGMTIYGDWDGDMFSDYKMKKDESNVLVLDKNGIIRYFVSGEIKDEEIGNIKKILQELINEKSGQ